MKNTFYQADDLERLSGYPEHEGEFRSPFQVDRDRILHTPAFRSLQSKTQVFWSGEYDFYRTRLTHSLEVAQIGRSICHWLLHHESNADNDLRDDYFIDPDLVEAACLSHDLGHPPFGHAGERVLNHHMANYGGFEGNAQTLRLLAERIFTQSRTGMNPTRAFLDAVLKYKSLHSELKTITGEAPDNHFIYDPQEKWLDWTLSGHDFPPELSPGDARDSAKSIECQIMDWADDSAYSLNDLADSARAGFLSEGRIRDWATAQGHSTDKGSPLGDLIKAIRADMVEPFVGRRIGNYIKATSLELDTNFLSGTSNRYKYRLEIDPALQAESKLFKDLSYEIVFQSPGLKQLEHKGTYILSRLWETLHREYIEGEKFHGQSFNLLPEAEAKELKETTDPAQKARLLCDYLAAQTDGSAVRLYQRLFLAGHGSIGDLMV